MPKNPRTIVVTGASRGIGAAIATELAGPGRHLFLTARSEAALERVVQRCKARGATGEVLPADLSSVENGTNVAERLRDSIGTPDVLVLNAGYAANQRFDAGDLQSKLTEIGVNYLAPLALISALLPEMRGRSRSIVAVSTLTVHVPFPGNASYAASKAALFTLLRSLRLELENDALHVGAVLPGYTDTEMSRNVAAPMPAMSPSRVARAVRECIEDERDCVVPGLTNTVAARLFQSLPEVFDPLLGAFGKHLMAGGGSR